MKGISKGQSVSPLMLSTARKLRRDMTPEERLFWVAVRDNRIDRLHFRRQQIVGRYVIDFFCEAADLAIELDGQGHLLSTEEDSARDQALRERGIEVMRFLNIEVRDNLDGVLKRIEDFARARRKT